MIYQRADWSYTGGFWLQAVSPIFQYGDEAISCNFFFFFWLCICTDHSLFILLFLLSYLRLRSCEGFFLGVNSGVSLIIVGDSVVFLRRLFGYLVRIHYSAKI